MEMEPTLLCLASLDNLDTLQSLPRAAQTLQTLPVKRAAAMFQQSGHHLITHGTKIQINSRCSLLCRDTIKLPKIQITPRKVIVSQPSLLNHRSKQALSTSHHQVLSLCPVIQKLL
jgi:hypothetical protein